MFPEGFVAYLSGYQDGQRQSCARDEWPQHLQPSYSAGYEESSREGQVCSESGKTDRS